MSRPDSPTVGRTFDPREPDPGVRLRAGPLPPLILVPDRRSAGREGLLVPSAGSMATTTRHAPATALVLATLFALVAAACTSSNATPDGDLPPRVAPRVRARRPADGPAPGAPRASQGLREHPDVVFIVQRTLVRSLLRDLPGGRRHPDDEGRGAARVRPRSRARRVRPPYHDETLVQQAGRTGIRTRWSP